MKATSFANKTTSGLGNSYNLDENDCVCHSNLVSMSLDNCVTLNKPVTTLHGLKKSSWLLVSHKTPTAVFWIKSGVCVWPFKHHSLPSSLFLLCYWCRWDYIGVDWKPGASYTNIVRCPVDWKKEPQGHWPDCCIWHPGNENTLGITVSEYLHSKLRDKTIQTK